METTQSWPWCSEGGNSSHTGTPTVTLTHGGTAPGHVETRGWGRSWSMGRKGQSLPALPLRPWQFPGWEWAWEYGPRSISLSRALLLTSPHPHPRPILGVPHSGEKCMVELRCWSQAVLGYHLGSPVFSLCVSRQVTYPL